MQGYEYFEVLEILRKHKKKWEEVFKMLEHWISGEERKGIFSILSELDKQIEDYTDRCITNNTCPNCGEPLQVHKWEDDCGKHYIHYCQDCDYKEED